MSNPRVIPREQLSAWEKWELASLHEAEAEAVAIEQVEVSDEPLDEPEAQGAEGDLSAESEDEEQLPAESADVSSADVSFPTAEEIEAIAQQAQSEGFEAGLEAGRLVAEDEANRLRAVLASVEMTLQKAEAALSNEVLDLAVVIARQMVREELNHAPERLLPILREVLASLPAARSPSRVFLNPEDLTAIAGMLGGDLPSDTWRLLADPHIEAGGCRIDTPDSAVDLSLPVRWQNILRVLGRNDRGDLMWNAREEHLASLVEEVSPAASSDDVSAPLAAEEVSASVDLALAEELPAAVQETSTESDPHD
ncbi:flagellar assembly protein FliH [Janthinobacterium sp. B9-8]|uniref:flagellar assembly protein FliH n=1 Tax=Janthinobacterium sp. B9-8 TaxID=1236179 RepID=UPI00061CE4A9|nr:flagellar assembly protein FliH [Janthinobacterium sp. B9-8]AMC34947.1 hypothetical protein VN23_10155 [Janthinobacterium sp. B9-8]